MPGHGQPRTGLSGANQGEPARGAGGIGGRVCRGGLGEPEAETLERTRWGRETVERFQSKRLQVKDRWHLHARSLIEALSQRMAERLNQELGNPPLQFAKLLVW